MNLLASCNLLKNFDSDAAGLCTEVSRKPFGAYQSHCRLHIAAAVTNSRQPAVADAHPVDRRCHAYPNSMINVAACRTNCQRTSAEKVLLLLLLLLLLLNWVRATPDRPFVSY
jgi:hypothetical protein